MKILNLYASIGGNRKLWTNEHRITAIEINEDIAKIYQDFYPKDKVIVTDAHEYLLSHFEEYDFIWSSPPCFTHSDIRRCGVKKGQYKAKYPDMKLYEEIILLKYFAKCKWVIENIKPYYSCLIKPVQIIHRHLFWSNFFIGFINFKDNRKHDKITGNSIIYGFDLHNYIIENKRKILRNMVNPEIGKYILEQAQYIGDLF